MGFTHMASSRQTSFTSIGSLPVCAARLEQLMDIYGFPPQQRCLCELILRGAGDKAAAAAMGLSLATIRTYVGRIYARASVASRTELVLAFFAKSHELGPCERCHLK